MLSDVAWVALISSCMINVSYYVPSIEKYSSICGIVTSRVSSFDSMLYRLVYFISCPVATSSSCLRFGDSVQPESE